MRMCDVGWRRRDMCGAVPPALLLVALFHHRAAARRWRSPVAPQLSHTRLEQLVLL